MLTLSRAVVRQYCQVLRKAGLTKRGRTEATIRIQADHGGLMFQTANDQLAVAYAIAGTFAPAQLSVPLSCLMEATRRTEGELQLTTQKEHVVASWTDHDVPMEQDYDLIPDKDVLPMPCLPTDWSENASTLVTALREAMRCTDRGSTRYALGCVQLQGESGQLTATDGRQALVQRGFVFPWSEKVLIPASPLLEASPLSGAETVWMGKTDQHVVLRIGPWTIIWTIQTEGRFPEVERILPSPQSVRSRLRLDPTDATFLAQRIDRLPQDDTFHHPVTVDLNGSVAIRARQKAEFPATELVLRRSQREGSEIRLVTDRRFLKRAVELGFSDIGFTSPDGPAVCREEQREYVWALLDAESAVPPTETARRVESDRDASQTERRIKHRSLSVAQA